MLANTDVVSQIIERYLANLQRKFDGKALMAASDYFMRVHQSVLLL